MADDVVQLTGDSQALLDDQLIGSQVALFHQAAIDPR
jgi:hypothetical protein